MHFNQSLRALRGSLCTYSFLLSLRIDISIGLEATPSIKSPSNLQREEFRDMPLMPQFLFGALERARFSAQHSFSAL